MSLFGTSPDESSHIKQASLSRNSLFDDEPLPTAVSGTSLFADDDVGKSPWSLNTPKKSGNVVKSLLPASQVPESYVDAYDALISRGDKVGSGISLTGVKKVLERSNISAQQQEKILNIVIPSGDESANGIGRGQFNVLLALIGLAQEHEDVSLDGVDERRRNLPEPNLPSLSTLKPLKVSDNPEDAMHTRDKSATPKKPASSPKHRSERGDSLGFDSDPWASPAVHKSHKHTENTSESHKINGSTPKGPVDDRNHGHISTFTTNGSSSPPSSSRAAPDPPASGADSGDGWAPYDANSSFPNDDNPGMSGEGFGDDPGRGSQNRPSGNRAATSSGVEEVITITVLPEKEGVFMFQHRNYQVTSPRRGSQVVRRYSDFVWLLDCLQKRYPFRLLPLLPPKRVAVNGNHLSADTAFIEKRRRGLARFSNALVRHPILNQEQLVVMFLTVPTELAVWRKQATVSVQEEFVGKSLPPSLEDSLPSTLTETFDAVRVGATKSAEIYINLCNLLERLAKRNEGVAADYLRFSLGLQSLIEASKDTYSMDTNDVPLLNEGLNSTAKHLSASQSLLEDEARAWDEGVLEDLKKQRDALVGVRDLFDRRDRYAQDNIPSLEKRIQKNEAKLVSLRDRPEGTVKPGEVEKVEDAIIKDKQSIVDQHARGVFIKECIRDELNYFQNSQYHVSKLHQDWSQERVKYAELQADNWRTLSEEVEGMPLGA